MRLSNEDQTSDRERQELEHQLLLLLQQQQQLQRQQQQLQQQDLQGQQRLHLQVGADEQLYSCHVIDCDLDPRFLSQWGSHGVNGIVRQALAW